MSAGDHLNINQFPTEMYSPNKEYRHEFTSHEFADGWKAHRIDAYKEYSGEDLPDDHVGHLEWDEAPAGEKSPHSGVIDSVEVHPEHQRYGVASSMYAMGRAMADIHGVHPPVHSTHRTDAGDAWAHSVTPRHKLPPSRKALRIPDDWK